MLHCLHMDQKEKKAFSLVSCILSFKHAFRGIWIFVSNTHNAWVQIVGGMIAALLGVYFRISAGEALALVISFGMLLMVEALNTAMEVHMNLTSPDHHPYARDTKDIAAGAVLIAVLVFLAVVAVVFVPHIFSFLCPNLTTHNYS
jgi:diacylglycerol kinase